MRQLRPPLDRQRATRAPSRSHAGARGRISASGAWIATEGAEQRALIRWCHLTRIPPAPDVEPGATFGDYIFAVPNGGTRNEDEAKLLRMGGVKAGVSDLIFTLARQGWHGLYIEMKAADGIERALQRSWRARMTRAGYLAVVIRTWTPARDLLLDYARSP